MTENCLFSGKVVSGEREMFVREVFPRVISEMQQKGNPGFCIIANNLEPNTHADSYDQ